MFPNRPVAGAKAPRTPLPLEAAGRKIVPIRRHHAPADNAVGVSDEMHPASVALLILICIL
jgi:hypothetical protein